jgi:glycosyltransferase involved in cell wall biosynthesis
VADRPRVLVDVQALQNPHSAMRGIGRYLAELLTAFRRDDCGVSLSYVLNPELPIRGIVESAASHGRVLFSDRLAPTDGDVFHIASPFEPAKLDRVWPRAVRDLPLAVTVHDLIPFLLPTLYMRDPRERQWLRTRLELIHRAHHLMAISRATAADLRTHAGIDAEKITVVTLGPAERFQPPVDEESAWRRLESALPQLTRGFVFYQGGMDYRKNLDRLVEAYAGLPDALRDAHQLVVACSLTPAHREEVDRLARRHALEGDLVFTGFVPDEVLLLLYQCAHICIFPSLYEGFGLPVAEAIACGTPVIASQSSSIPELIERDEALFDPFDPSSIRDTLRRALEDEDFFALLKEARLAPAYSWSEASRITSAVYVATAQIPRRVTRAKPHLAVAMPQPDEHRLPQAFAAVSDHYAVDFFVDDPRPCKGRSGPVALRSIRHIDLLGRARGGYDGLVVALDGSPRSADRLALVLGHGGHVVMPQPDLTRAYTRLRLERPDAERRSFKEALRSMYGERLPRELQRRRTISPSDARRYGLLMTADVAAASSSLLVQSDFAAQYVALDAGGRHAHKIAILPVAFPEPVERRPSSEELLVARLTQGEHVIPTLLDAIALAARELPLRRLGVVLGGGGRRQRARLQRLLAVSDLDGLAVDIVTEKELAVWQPWLATARAVLHLSDGPDFVVPLLVQASLATGVPTVATASGALRELPEGTIVRLHESTAADLARAIQTAAGPEGTAVGEAARDHARGHTPEQLGVRLHELISAHGADRVALREAAHAPLRSPA